MNSKSLKRIYLTASGNKISSNNKLLQNINLFLIQLFLYSKLRLQYTQRLNQVDLVLMNPINIPQSNQSLLFRTEAEKLVLKREWVPEEYTVG